MDEFLDHKEKYTCNLLSSLDTEIPRLLFADERGQIYDHPRLLMTGMSGHFVRSVRDAPFYQLPDYSKLFFLPDSPPIGEDPETGEIVILDEITIKGRSIRPCAVSAFLPPGYLRLYLPASTYPKNRSLLPLWAYCAVGIIEDKFYVPAIMIDDDPKWHPDAFDDEEMLPEIQKILANTKNRLYKHLSKCAIEYHCFAAKNLFLKRWEAPLPVSRRCNARCLGCLSLQKNSGFLASHERIKFKPKVREVVEIGVKHLDHAPDPIISFGQGCEGEPLTESGLIKDSITEIRRVTEKGTINLNTNGSYPEKIKELINAGLDSIRISLISARASYYKKYYRPKDYSFEDVKESIKRASNAGIFTMINYLVFPGFNDQMSEIDALSRLIEETSPNFVHLKNLNIDPMYFIKKMGMTNEPGIGLEKAYKILKNRFPSIRWGYFNKQVRQNEASGTMREQT